MKCDLCGLEPLDYTGRSPVPEVHRVGGSDCIAALRAALEAEREGREASMERQETLGRAAESLRSELASLRCETYCAYCSARFPLDDGAASVVGEHIKTCPKHPMRDPERERDAAIARVEKMEAAVSAYLKAVHKSMPDFHFLGKELAAMRAALEGR